MNMILKKKTIFTAVENKLNLSTKNKEIPLTYSL